MAACHVKDNYFQFGAVCHGDLWWSNILFKYGPEDHHLPEEVKFIDFQSARLASVVTDILSFTFTSMSSQVRRENIYDLLEVRQGKQYLIGFVPSVI